MGVRALGLLPSIAVIVSLGSVHGLFYPADNYLINCGSSVSTTVGPRTFVADSPFSWSLSTPQAILAVNTSILASSSDSSALCPTARIFTGESAYSFPIQGWGRHWIRLHFFPFLYQGFDLSAAEFSVSTQDFVLLSNFRAPNHSAAVLKEYSVNVTSSSLVLCFSPSGNASAAFVNAIEVVSVPDGLFPDYAETALDPTGLYQGVSEKALETVYRINMGGPEITPAEDTLSRTWVPDLDFLLEKGLARSVGPYSGIIKHLAGETTRETAPDSVYRTATSISNANTSDGNFNVTWVFPVDAGFRYLIRFHFYDILRQFPSQLYFNVYANGWAAAVRDLDLAVATTSGWDAAYAMDFVAEVGNVSPISRLLISIEPSAMSNVRRNAILNGLEIMKMINAGSYSAPPKRKNKVGLLLGFISGASGAVAIAIFVLSMALRRWRKRKKRTSGTGVVASRNRGVFRNSASGFRGRARVTPSGKMTSVGFLFPLVVLQEATNNFDEQWVVGGGGFGKVYKGVLRDQTRVAVKRRSSPSCQQGLREFRAEIELLSRLRHRHLVSLIGYCDEQGEMILVYEYLEKGTLRSHLYGSDLPALSWKQRLEVCIAAARGLHYLHTGQARPIIHRDVKSSNILLDGRLTAKVADFGLSREGPEQGQAHVSTAVKGSFGYLDPEYFRMQQLTEKSDVYSFGVVLVEVLCARPVIDHTLPVHLNLAGWALERQREGRLEQVGDPRLAGTIRAGSLRVFGETVEKCLQEYGSGRPAMGDVLRSLERALQLQEELVPSDPDVNGGRPDGKLRGVRFSRSCSAPEGRWSDVGDACTTEALSSDTHCSI